MEALRTNIFKNAKQKLATSVFEKYYSDYNLLIRLWRTP